MDLRTYGNRLAQHDGSAHPCYRAAYPGCRWRHTVGEALTVNMTDRPIHATAPLHPGCRLHFAVAVQTLHSPQQASPSVEMCEDD